MKKLLIALLFLTVAVWLGIQINHDPGYALFSHGHWTMEMPLWLAILMMIIIITIVFYLIRILNFVGTFGERVSAWQNRRRAQSAHRQLDQGLIELTEGRWHHAEELLAHSAKYSDIPVISFLTAARAAHEQGAYERRDEYLAKAHHSTKKAQVAVSLTQAELQLSHKQFEQALATLTHLRSILPHHTYVLRLLKKLYLELKEWESLADLLPLLSKYKVLKPAEFDELATTTYHKLLSTAATEEDFQKIESIWQHIPRELQDNPALFATYVRSLLAHGQDNLAVTLLTRALKKHWHAEWLLLYGQAKGNDPDQQLYQVEQWLKQFPENAILLLSAGRLAMRSTLWGKARSYLEASLAIEPRVETYQVLGDLLENTLHDHEAAFACYKLGVQQSRETVMLTG